MDQATLKEVEIEGVCHIMQILDTTIEPSGTAQNRPAERAPHRGGFRRTGTKRPSTDAEILVPEPDTKQSDPYSMLPVDFKLDDEFRVSGRSTCLISVVM